ncbi:MAG: DUF2868 domain-containing protein [Pseudomonadota bacterium]
MNEQVARDVVLVQAIETADVKREILSDDDRMYASRSARELAQWQASDSKSAVTAEHFLQQRAEQILKRIGERVPVFATLLQRRGGMQGLSIALPLIALMLGAGLDRLGDPHRMDLLSAPLLGIIGWNLAVYLLLVPLMRVKWSGPAWMSGVAKALPRKLPHVLAGAVTQFMLQWGQLGAGLNRARFHRIMHLSAATFALGAILSLYARGFFSQYVAGWESTFLNGPQVHAILSVLFAPAVFVFPLQGFSLADIEALRFPAGAAGGARWVHLYAATLFLLVVLPRGAMAAVAHWKARRLERHFPLDLEHPYFKKLGGQAGVSGPVVLRVLPYSFTVDEARDKGLSQLAAMLFGDQARVMLRPPSAYGDEPEDLLRDVNLDDANVTAVLFNLAATPEKENHGVFLDHLVRNSKRAVSVLIDESALLERSGAERVAERRALWQQFCQFHRTSPTFVNLLHPQP